MRATIQGRDTSYEVVGQGRPLVLLHAFPFDRRLWEPTVTALQSKRQVITVDLRGFGESPLSSEPFSIANLADDVAALLDHLDVNRATVGGLSMGGYVALAFAARHPQRLNALMLADTKADADSPQARQGRAEAIALVTSEGVDAYLDQQIPRLLSPGAPEPVRAQAHELGRQKAPAILAGLQALRDRPDRRPELSSIHCPTLILVGAEDTVTPPSDAAILAEGISGSRLIEIPRAGHLSNLEAPGAFAAALSTLA